MTPPRPLPALLGLALAATVAAQDGAERPLRAASPTPTKVAPATPPSVPAGPHGVAVVEETVFDAGQVERGATVEHRFAIKNTGSGELTILAKAG